MHTIPRRSIALALGLLMGVANLANAQATFPDKPIRIILGFAPGAITDTVASAVGAQMSKNLGQPVVVENRAGAGGTLASEAVARAPADGYTLLLGEAGGMSINPLLMPNLSYNPERDFVPIAQVVNLPLVLVAHPGANIKKVGDLATYGAANKGLNYGTAGPGTIQHLSVELFKVASKLPFNHIPYRGGAPALNDLVGGQIPLLSVTVATVSPQVKAGQAIPVVLLGKSRSAAMPTVPTLVEAGFQNIEMGNPWQGFFAPASTPPAIINRLNAEIRKAVEAPEVRDRLTSAGAEVVVGSSEDFRVMLRAEKAAWTQAIQAGGVKPQ
jgi:tripartite-type tricarboxylate transporter receptor subunit TctC